MIEQEMESKSNLNGANLEHFVEESNDTKEKKEDDDNDDKAKGNHFISELRTHDEEKIEIKEEEDIEKQARVQVKTVLEKADDDEEKKEALEDEGAGSKPPELHNSDMSKAVAGEHQGEISRLEDFNSHNSHTNSTKDDLAFLEEQLDDSGHPPEKINNEMQNVVHTSGSDEERKNQTSVGTISNHSLALLESDIYTRCGNVTITIEAFDRFSNPRENSGYLNDELIEMQRLNILQNLEPEKRDKVHCFQTLFYRAKLEDQNQDLGNWTRRIELFGFDYIFFFINSKNHWSLCVVMRPLEWMIDTYLCNNNEPPKEDKSPLKQSGCILFLDSLRGGGGNKRLHDPIVIGSNIKKFLSSVWKRDALKNNIRASKPNATKESFSSYTEMELSDYMHRIESTETYNNDVIKDKCFFDSIPMIDCPHSPMQFTGFDCGIFAYKYFDAVVHMFPSSFTSDLNNSFKDWIRPDLFTQQDVTNERNRYITYLQASRMSYLAQLWGESAEVDEYDCDVNYIGGEKPKNNDVVAAYELTRHEIFLDIYNSIGGMHSFIDAQIQYKKMDITQTISCNAGTVVTFDKKNPLILIAYVPATIAWTSFEGIQVLTVNMDEHKDELLRLFSISDSKQRMQSICTENSTLSILSQAWETFSQADQIFGFNVEGENDDQQHSWWFGHNAPISDIASALLLRCMETDKMLLKTSLSAPSSLTALECFAWVNEKDEFVKLKVTFGLGNSSTKPKMVTTVYVDPIRPKGTKSQQYSMLDVFKNIDRKPKSSVDTSVEDKSTSSKSFEVDIGLPRPSSGRPIKKPMFLRDESLLTSSKKRKECTKKKTTVTKKKNNIIEENELSTDFTPKKYEAKNIKSSSKTTRSSSSKPASSKDFYSFISNSHHDENDDSGYYNSSNFSPSHIVDDTNMQAPLKRLRSSSNRSDMKTIDASSTMSFLPSNCQFLENKIRHFPQTSLMGINTSFVNATKSPSEGTGIEKAEDMIDVVKIVADAQEAVRKEEALKSKESLQRVEELHSKYLEHVADVTILKQSHLENALAERELKIGELEEESKRSKANLLALQLKAEEAEKKLAAVDIAKVWVQENTKLKESNLVLETKLKSIKKGKKELMKSSAKEREIVMQIFKEGLSHTEKTNQQQNILAKTCLNSKSSSSSSQLQLLQQHSSNSSVMNKKVKDRKRKKRSKEKKRRKKAKEEALKLESDIRDAEVEAKSKDAEAKAAALKLESDIRAAEVEAKSKDDEAKAADNRLKMLLNALNNYTSTNKKKKRRSKSISSSSSSSSSATESSSSAESESSSTQSSTTSGSHGRKK